MTVPEGLPILSSGKHFAPEYGACFMEYTALLAGEPFSDHPRCVDRELGRVMMYINDNISHNETRTLLVPLLGRAIGLVAPQGSAAMLRFRAAERFYAEMHRQYSLDLNPGRSLTVDFGRCLEAVLSKRSSWLMTIGTRPWTEIAVELATILHECYEQAMVELGYPNEWTAVRNLAEVKQLVTA